MISPVSFNSMLYKPCFKGINAAINRTRKKDSESSHKPDSQCVKADAKCDAKALMLQIRKKALKGEDVQKETSLLKAYADSFQDDLEFQMKIYNYLAKYGSDE